jgi:hypothetical protein
MFPLQWKHIENSLNALISPTVHFYNRNWSSFRLFGCIGLIMAILQTILLVSDRNLSMGIMLWVVIAALGTFFLLAMVTKIITGEEKLIYYHHEIAVMLTATWVLWMLHQPVLPYLDITVLGIGTFLIFGRIGCLMVGCCHGLPSKWGVVYGPGYSFAGVSPHLSGVRLLPVQVIESLWVSAIVIGGIVLVMSGQPPGEALAWYVIIYGLGRFLLEFMRGDTGRPYYFGFSEAQWISLLLVFAVVWAGLEGTMVFRFWHLGVSAFLGLTMIIVAIGRIRIQGSSRNHFLHPDHMREVAEAVQLASNLAVKGSDVHRQGDVPVSINLGCTSLGIRISSSKINHVKGHICHYAISCQKGILPEKDAKAIAKFIMRMKHPSGPEEFLKGTNGNVFHLLIHHPETQELKKSNSFEPQRKII